MKRSNTKSRIVEAAWELFYEVGYDGTTVEDIVARSATSKGSFYHYFESKDALLGSLAYLFDAKYEELEGGITEEEDSFELLLRLNRELFDMVEKRVDVALLSRLISAQLMVKLSEKLRCITYSLKRLITFMERNILYLMALMNLI